MSRQNPDSRALNKKMYLHIQNNELNDAIETYQTLLQNGLTNEGTHQLIINFAKNNQPNNESMQYAIQAYENALYLEQYSVKTFTALITTAGKYHDVELLLQVYNRAMDIPCVDVITHNAVIVAASKNNRPDIMEAAFARTLLPATPAERTTASTYASMITAAGRNRNIPKIAALYTEALNTGCTDSAVHNSVISAIGNIPAYARHESHIQLATQAYLNACMLGQIDSVTARALLNNHIIGHTRFEQLVNEAERLENEIISHQNSSTATTQNVQNNQSDFLMMPAPRNVTQIYASPSANSETQNGGNNRFAFLTAPQNAAPRIRSSLEKAFLEF